MYWKDYPPEHLLVRGALGLGPAAPARLATEDEVRELVSMVQGG
jgi:hypothetical protein